MSDTTWTLLCVGIAVVVALISAFVAVTIRKSTVEKKIGSAEDKAREIIDEAIKTAEAKKEALLEAKEENLRTKNELDKEIKERRAEVQRYEKRVLTRKSLLKRSQMHLRRKKIVLKLMKKS
ncbi:MAG: Rnase Y domain-containing protein [Eubacterium sp.]